MHKFLMLVGIAILMSFSPNVQAQSKTEQKLERKQWVAKCLREMQTIKVGMTRKDLAKVFTTEGGIYSPAWGHYVYRECPYFKVDVEFAVVMKKGRAAVKRTDKIKKISQPYLQWTIMD